MYTFSINAPCPYPYCEYTVKINLECFKQKVGLTNDQTGKQGR